ncbi:MAG: guanylate kinase [Bacteroidota bacterium]
MESPSGKLIIFTAPSGAGKTTIVRYLLQKFDQLAFSVSATSRAQRPGEKHGKDYYFLSVEEFRQAIDREAFAEWEEVYQGQYYGTLKQEIQRLWAEGKHILFDIDVQGALHLKKVYGTQALVVFVQPPSLEALEIRLRGRQTEDEASFKKRIAKAAEELSFAPSCDRVLINDDLETTLKQAEEMILSFIK